MIDCIKNYDTLVNQSETIMASESVISSLLDHYKLDPFCVANKTSIAFFAFFDVLILKSLSSNSKMVVFSLQKHSMVMILEKTVNL